MPRFDWKGLLTRWSEGLLAYPEIADRLPEEVRRSGWIGYPPATEEEVRRAEARLGVTLPPSYREFLEVTNGWPTTGFFIHRLLPVEEIDWFQTLHPETIQAWLEGARTYGPLPAVPDEEYLIYGEGQRSGDLRWEYLETALAVSEQFETNILLLNPRVVTPEGEWEAWFLAHWLPGARRYRSFWDLMQAQYAAFLDLTADGQTPWM